MIHERLWRTAQYDSFERIYTDLIQLDIMKYPKVNAYVYQN